MVEQKLIPVCGAESETIPNSRNVDIKWKCTEQPNHTGKHKTIVSVFAKDHEQLGFEYSWSK